MARKSTKQPRSTPAATQPVSASANELMLAALERGGDVTKTGRFPVTFKDSATDAGAKMLSARRGLRVANARDFAGQAVDLAAAGDAGAMVFPEIGVALVGAEAAVEHGIRAAEFVAEESPVHSVDPEYFHVRRAAQSARPSPRRPAHGGDDRRRPRHAGGRSDIARRLRCSGRRHLGPRGVQGARRAISPLMASRSPCSTPASTSAIPNLPAAPSSRIRSSDSLCRTCMATERIRPARPAVRKRPAGAVPRYGIGYRSQMFIGKVLTNSGSGTQAQVLAGMNWAITNRCAVISMSLGAQIPVQPSYTAAGTAALNAGCLIIAASGNASSRPGIIAPAGAPANSPSVMSVAALDSGLRVAVFSNGGKVDIAGPGVNVFSSWPRPTLHNTISGTSMATPHVAGCAAPLGANESGAARAALRAKLIATARHLPLPMTDVGAGLVRAP